MNTSYTPLSDAEHYDRVQATRAELAAQLKADFPDVATVEWLDEHTVRAADAAGGELARGQSLASLRALLPYQRHDDVEDASDAAGQRDDGQPAWEASGPG